MTDASPAAFRRRLQELAAQPAGDERRRRAVDLAHEVLAAEREWRAVREEVLAAVNAAALELWHAEHPDAGAPERAYARAWSLAAKGDLPVAHGLSLQQASAIRRWFRDHQAGPPESY